MAEPKSVKVKQGGLFFAKRISGAINGRKTSQELSPMVKMNKLKKINSVMCLPEISSLEDSFMHTVE